MLLEDLEIWKQALADGLKHGIVRWISHIFRIKIDLFYVGVSFLGYWFKTRRFPPIFSFKFWCFLASSFFKGVACMMDNQYEDYERDKDDPKKWGQPPRWIYKWLTATSMVLVPVTASFVSLPYGLFSGLETIGLLAYTTPPIQLKFGPIPLILLYMVAFGCIAPFVGYIGACNSFKDFISSFHLHTILNFMAFTLANSINMAAPIWDFKTDAKRQPLISDVLSIVRKMRICLFGAFTLWFTTFKSKISKILSIIGVLLADKLCNELLEFPSHGNVHKTERLCLLIVGCYACIYISQIIYDEINSMQSS